MGAPSVHAELSAKRFGGKPEDYIKIHELMDSSKAAMPDLRHRTLTHNSWFVATIVERIFGPTITIAGGKKVAVRDICQWHIMEDFGGSFPSAQDYLINMEFKPWMNNGENGAMPPSNQGLPPFDKNELDPEHKKKQEEERQQAEARKRLEESLKQPEPGGEKMRRMIEEDPPYRRGCGGAGRLD